MVAVVATKVNVVAKAPKAPAPEVAAEAGATKGLVAVAAVVKGTEAFSKAAAVVAEAAIKEAAIAAEAAFEVVVEEATVVVVVVEAAVVTTAQRSSGE